MGPSESPTHASLLETGSDSEWRKIQARMIKMINSYNSMQFYSKFGVTLSLYVVTENLIFIWNPHWTLEFFFFYYFTRSIEDYRFTYFPCWIVFLSKKCCVIYIFIVSHMYIYSIYFQLNLLRNYVTWHQRTKTKIVKLWTTLLHCMTCWCKNSFKGYDLSIIWNSFHCILGKLYSW